MKVSVFLPIITVVVNISCSFARGEFDNTPRYANNFNKYIPVIFPDKILQNQTLKSKGLDLQPSSSFGLGHYSRHHFGGFGFGGYPGHGHYGYFGLHSPYRRVLNPYYGISPFIGGYFGGHHHHHQFHYGHYNHHGFGGYPGIGYGHF